MTERTWIVEGKPVTLAQFKARVATASKAARERFARDWRGLSPVEAIQIVVANAHLFHAKD
jgi:hypothetical protein